MRLAKIFRRPLLAFLAAMTAAITALAAPANQEPAELTADKVSYDVAQDKVTASGNVVMTTTDGRTSCDFAEYFPNEKKGRLLGRVIADKQDMHLECDEFILQGEDKFVAKGNVRAKQLDRQYTGPIAEYDQKEDYLRMVQGGTVQSQDGTFSADFMEGWPKKHHFFGRGNCSLDSPPKNFQGGGDTAEYFGEDSGRAVFRGNAWARQNNQRLKSNEIVVYLDDKSGVQARDAAAEPREKETPAEIAARREAEAAQRAKEREAAKARENAEAKRGDEKQKQ